MSDSYKKVVENLEDHLAPYAVKSFDSTFFIDGSEVFKYYTDIWKKDIENVKLNNRTPIQHQRDKILYSNGVRKQSEKYHILYKGGQRIIRNYITHTMRMMQVTKTICRALKLNEDFAESIALGSKIGALPFIHASKNKVSKWVMEKIRDIDDQEQKFFRGGEKEKTLFPDSDYLPDYPEWIRKLQNKKILSTVERYIPFAQGQQVNDGYSSGKQGYWLLTVNPYTAESQAGSFTPELMYGIWRHSLKDPIGKNSFVHRQNLEKNQKDYIHAIDWRDITYEAIVVKYADDITWIIENLNDANNAMLINSPGAIGLFQELYNHGNFENPLLISGLSKRDSGKLYSFFINDFVHNSLEILKSCDLEMKFKLKAGESACGIGLSAEGEDALLSFKRFLTTKVFEENRIAHRKKMLETISEGCMDLIYNGKDEYLNRYIETKAAIEGWEDDKKKLAIGLLNNDVHRVQVAVNVFSELSDQEIFSFVGMDSL